MRVSALRALNIGVFALLIIPVGQAAELKKETLAAWDSYIERENLDVQKKVAGQGHFLWSEAEPNRIQEILSGSILTAPVGVQNPARVPSGLIHHWIGSAFIPNAKVVDVIAVMRDYGHYKDYYTPSVEDAKSIRRADNKDEFMIRFVNGSLLSKTSLEGEYVSEYVEVDGKRWYSVSRTTQMQEIKDFGRDNEKRLPPDQGSGYIWRLYSTARLVERDGGVVIELEAIVLSRDVPGSLHWLVDPIIRRISRESIEKSLRETAAAVRVHADQMARIASSHQRVSTGSR